MQQIETIIVAMRNLYPLFFLFILTLFLSPVAHLQAENPPHAKILNAPTTVGSDLEFTITMDGTSVPDCGTFFFNCNTNSAGIENMDVYWAVYEVNDCAGCDLGGTEIASGIIDHGFWGTNCTANNTDEGVDCTAPGGCDRTFTIASNLLCPGATYEIVTYAFNVDYTKGVADNSSEGPGPWRCCDGDPALGNLESMEDCTLPLNGGTGGGWLNPSYPQTYTYVAAGDPPMPTLSTTSTLADGGTLICGENFSTDITITPNSACPPTKVTYTLLLNGESIGTETSDCVEMAETFNYTATIIGCPYDPNCDAANVDGVVNALCSEFGTNTLRWEARQDCDNALVAFEEITFTLDCAEPDNLSIEADDQFLCPGESGTVAVNVPANVNIPYTGGSYELHWNNANPYENPSNNYLGTGETATLTNDGTYPLNTPITISGTIWEDYSTVAPAGCEVFAGTAEFVMLSAIGTSDENDACGLGQINVSATGGLPAYDNTSSYTFDATSAGAGTNNTGLFTTLEGSSDSIPEGNYTITVTDDENCSTTIDVEVYNPISITLTPTACNDFNTFTLNVSGGQPDHPDYQDLTQYTVFSDIDGFLGNPDANGDFTATSISAGNHTITLEYEHEEGGVGSGTFCSNTAIIEVYDNFDIDLGTDFCDFVNGVDIAAVTGGQDPNNTVGGGFAGAAYTVFLSTTAAPSATNDVTSAEGSLTGAGSFTGVAAGDYFVVVEDERDCQFSVPVTVIDLGDFTLSNETIPCTNNTISLESTGGNPDWTYWLYDLGEPFDGGTSAAINPVTSTTQSPGVYTAAFNNIFVGQYTVYAQDADGCVTLSVDVDVYNEVELEEVTGNCSDFNTITVEASGGYAGAPYIMGVDFTYTLLDTDGTTILESNNTGTFTGYDAGLYTVEVSDNNASVTPCIESLEVEIYDEWEVTFSTDPCVGENSIEVTSVMGGRDPAITGFTGAQYTIILSTSANSTNPALDQNNLPLSFTTSDPATDIPFIFDDLVDNTEYYIVVTDGTSDVNGACSFAVGPIDLSNPINLEVTPNTCSTFNSVSAEVVGGAATNDFYIYPLGAALQGAPDPPNTDYNPTAAANGAVNDLSGNDLAITGVAVADFTEVPAGSYTLYAVDGNGCQVSSTDIEVYDPFDIVFDGDACSFFNEIPLADVLGGRDPDDGFAGAGYSIFLSTTPAPGAINDVSTNEGILSDAGTFTGITSGSYFVILEDDRGCQYSEGVSIDEAAIMTATITDCTTAGGTAQATITGGGVPDWIFYLYTSTGTFDAADPENADNGWTATDAGDGSGSDVTGDFSGIAGGTYTIYALDQNGCQPQASVEVEIYESFVLDVTADDCGSGEVVVNAVSGGKDPAVFAGAEYEIYLSTEPAPNGVLNVFSNELTLGGAGTFTGVSDGTYYVIVEDDNGCQFGTLFTMGELITISQQGGNCLEGSVNVTVNNGSPDWDFYIYDIDGTFDAADPENADNGWIASDLGDGSGDDNLGAFTGLDEGDYMVYAVDQNGCERSLGVVVFDELVVTDITETCDYGGITVTASGGNPAVYSFGLVNSLQQLEDVNSTGIFTDLDFDTYSVIVSDINGCTASVDDLVVNTTEIDLTAASNCTDGFTATGGAGNFTYSLLSIPDNVLVSENTTGDFSDVAANNYTLVVTDDNDCTFSQVVTCLGDPCDLAATATTECVDLENFNVIVSLSGTSTYTLDDGENDALTGQTAGDITLGSLANGNYSITVTDEVNTCDDIVLTGSEDCFNCDLEVTTEANCVDNNGYNLSVTIAGNGNYTVSDDSQTLLTNQSAGTVVLDTLIAPDTDYTFYVVSSIDETCADTTTVNNPCEVCDLAIDAINTNCTDLENFDAVAVISGTSTYTVSDGVHPDLTGQMAGSIDLGSFAGGSTIYTLTVTDENVDDCSFTQTFTQDCFSCNLSVTATEECIDLSNYEVTVVVSGSGTYSITDGVSTNLTNQPAGTYTLEPLPSGEYSITVTSDTDAACSETITGNVSCFDCELNGTIETECLNVDTYEVSLTFGGEGTYTIDNGLEDPLTNQASGTYTFSPYPNGAYSIEVTSEVDPTCTQTFTGSKNCFECGLATANISTECVDLDNYEVTFDLSGNGTYAIQYNGETLTGQTEGTITVGPFAEGAYSIVISSEEDLTCTQTLTGEHTCFECDLVLSNVGTDCLDNDNYEVSFSLEGTGTFSISDGVNNDLTGQTAGFYTLGTYPEGAYSITVTSETDETCTETITGTRDCFLCDIQVLSAVPTCVDANSFNVLLTFTGEGLYTITNNSNITLTNQTAGTINLSSFANGAYVINIISEEDPTCQEVITGTNECFECILPSFATTNCIDDDSFEVIFTLTGDDSYTINYNNTSLTGQTAGNISVGPFPNGGYSITVTSETDDNCSQDYTGILDCTPDVICDPSVVAVAECIDEMGYNLNLTLGGTGTFTIEYEDVVLTGQTAGEIVIGPFANGGYTVLVTNEDDPDCQLPISGSNDCTAIVPCDVAVTSSTTCAGNTGYNVELVLTGTGTFSVDDGINPTLFNQTAGTIIVGPIPNIPYTIAITNEADETCAIEVSGSDDCTFNCDLAVESFVNCIEGSGNFEVVVSIAGNSTYTVSDGVNPPLTGVTQGDITVGPFSGATGDYEITITNEANSFCFQTISGTKFCDTPCNLFVTLDDAVCTPEGLIDVTITIEGSSTYTINYGFFGDAITGATAGTYVLENIFIDFDDFYNIFVQDETNFSCNENLSGAGVCDEDCSLTGEVTIDCLEEGGFDMTVTFEGNEDILYDVFINLGFGTLDTLLFDVSPGTYVFEGFSADFYSVSISENEIFEDCFINFNGSVDCDPIAECDLNAEITTNCVDEDNFEVVITIEGSSSYYVQISGDIDIFLEEENLSAGTYTFGPFPDNSFDFFGYSVFIEDEINNTFECFEATFISRNCDSECDFTVNYDVLCNNDFTFNVEITIEGSSTYDIFGDFNPEPILDVPAGTYILGPYPQDFFFFFNVTDNQNPACFQDIFGIENCDFDAECDLNANIGTTCVEGEGSFIVEVSITGSDTYTISNGDEVVLTGVSEGAFFIGPFENGNFSITITNENNPLCNQNFTGGFFCEPPPTCDLSADFFIVCNPNNTGFGIEVKLTGTSTYQIVSNGEVVASGIPGETPIIVGEFSNNDSYDIVVTDENNSLCTQSFSGVYACSAAPSCNLGATVNVVCLDDNSGGYNLEIELTGSGSYFIETFVTPPLEGQTAGTILVGPFFDEFYNVLIFKENDDACNVSFFGTADCQPDFPPCDVTVQLDIECINDDEYLVTMFIEGNSTYDILEGLYVDLPDNNLLMDNVSPGTITMGPFENGVYDLLILDENNPTCYLDFIGARNCNNPDGCNINAGVTTFCNADSTSFNLVLNLEGTSTYEVTIFQELGGPVILNLENQPAGAIEAGPIFGDEYYIFIQDEERPFCTQDFLGIKSCTPQEEPTCDLELGAETECLADGSGFNVILDLMGSGTYTIEDGFTGTLFDVEAGEIVLGPYPNGFFYNIFVQSEDNFTCFGGLNGFADCSDGVVCDLTTDIELNCIEGDTYTIDLTIEGTGTFNVNSNLGDLSGVSAGTYTFGPAALNSYDFTVQNAFNPECQQNVSGTENCTDEIPPCDLSVASSTACTDDESFVIALTVSGSDVYTVYSNGEPIQTGVTAGELEVGPYDSGNSYNIEVVNESNADCRESASGIRNCSIISECNLTANAETVCLDNSRFQIIVNFSGEEGETYTLSDGVNTPITGQESGEVVLGPLFNGDYSVSINSESDPTCSLAINGSKDCEQVLPCDIEVTDVEVTCTSSAGYSITFEFEGTGTFSISDNIGTTLTGQSEGTYTFDNFENGDYGITISSEITPDCSLTFNGSRDCLTGGCDLLAIPQTICTDNGDYLVEVELSGSSTYTLNDGVNPPMSNQSSGSILMGPLPQGNYFITITDDTDPDCSVILEGSQTCPSLLATIGNIVFNDVNQNGLQDDEAKVQLGLSGINVSLVNTVFGEIATDVTNGDGEYSFADVPAGDYFLVFEIPDGFSASPQDVGFDDTIDSDIGENGMTNIFTVAEGAIISHMDAGMFDEGECAGFAVTVNEICPLGPASTFYQLGIAIEGGTPPYTIDVGPYYFNDQITPADFPLEAIGEIPVQQPYNLIIRDANGCQEGPFSKVVGCVTVGVELLTFEGEVQKEGNLLQWVTASETNNDYFTLLRSANGIDFEPIAKVEGNGTSSETHLYDFLDRNAPNGRSYYRLDQTDFDGSQTSSNVISLLRSESVFDIVQVSPIPTTDRLQLQFNNSQEGAIDLRLYDIVGREMLVQQIEAKTGFNTHSLSLATYPSGTYLLVLSNGTERRTVKVVKE